MTGCRMTRLLVLQWWLLVRAEFGSARAAVAKAATTGQIEGTRHNTANRIKSFLFQRAYPWERVQQSHCIGMKRMIKDRSGSRAFDDFSRIHDRHVVRLFGDNSQVVGNQE